MSDQAIEITLLNVAYYFVEFCEQNNIRTNEFKTDNYVERRQQPLVSDELKEDFKTFCLPRQSILPNISKMHVYLSKMGTKLDLIS